MNPAPRVTPFEVTCSERAFETRVFEARRGVGVANMMFFVAGSHADLLGAPGGLELSYTVKETSTLKMKQYVRNANCYHVAANEGIVAEFDLDYGQVVTLHEKLGIQLTMMKPDKTVQLRRSEV